eukprot:3863537-Alexandrium_andersonii.AAC.1
MCIRDRCLKPPELRGAVSGRSETPPPTKGKDRDPKEWPRGWESPARLIASIAALAEHPSAVRGLFVEADVGAG